MLGVWLFVLPLGSPWTLALAGTPWAFGYGCAGPLQHARLSALSGRWWGSINSYHASLLNLGIFSVSALIGQMASMRLPTATNPRSKSMNESPTSGSAWGDIPAAHVWCVIH
jgi:hypothetical protein